jgi:putative ABC transport system ATP-binding protein
MTAPMGIRLDSVSKHYGTGASAVRAVDGITMGVEPGASLAMVGPSGCGKSTLLGLIGGLESPTHGRVMVGELEISSLPESARARVRRESFGFIFQSHVLLPFLTVTENLMWQLALRGKSDGATRCQQLLAYLGLADHAQKLPDQLSGGQRQRVALARALIHGPSVILADEPTGELDSETSTAVIGLLVAAQRAAGVTLIVVTHDDRVAQQLDRTLHLRDGRLDGQAEPPGDQHSRA